MNTPTGRRQSVGAAVFAAAAIVTAPAAAELSAEDLAKLAVIPK